MENLLIAAAARQQPHVAVPAAARSAGARGDGGAAGSRSASAMWRDQKAGELPEGKRKLADIAVALALKPRLLLLDEPTSGVASSEKLAIMDILVARARAEARHVGVRRARHGHGDALCGSRRGLERRKDPDDRSSRRRAGRPERRASR